MISEIARAFEANRATVYRAIDRHKAVLRAAAAKPNTEAA